MEMPHVQHYCTTFIKLAQGRIGRSPRIVDEPNAILIDNRSAGFSSTGFALYLRKQKRPL